MKQQELLFELNDGPVGDLVIQRVNHETTRIPCEQWHYAARMPGGSIARYGVWEQQQFKGVFLYGPSANNNAHSPFNVNPSQIVELQRIALISHVAPVTKMIAETMRMLKVDAKGLQLVISYADPMAGHVGYVYQAASWVYLGMTGSERVFYIKNKPFHSKAVLNKYGTKEMAWLRANVDPNVYKTRLLPKHKYAFPLTRKMRKLCESLKQPYPKSITCQWGGTWA